MRNLESVSDSGVHVEITLPVFLAERRRIANHHSAHRSHSKLYRSVPVKGSVHESCQHLWRWRRAATKCARGHPVSNRVHGLMQSPPLGWARGVRPVALVPCRSGASSRPFPSNIPPQPVIFPCIWIFNVAGGLTLELVTSRMCQFLPGKAART
jgi:hypothetical protein